MGFREAWPGILVGMTLATVATIAACGSAVTSPGASCTPDSGRACTVDAGAEDGSRLASPPPPGPMQPADGTSTVTFAVSSVLWGNTDPDGGLDLADGWKQYGYNIDGVAPGDVAAFCKPVQGASATLVHQEGIDGIENAFGHIVLPLLPENTTIDNCICCDIPRPSTVLLSLDQLGTGSSYNPLPARVASSNPPDNYFDAGGCGYPPFDGTDVWPVDQGTAESLTASYFVNDTWVSGPIARLSVVFQGIDVPQTPFPFDIVHARITMRLDPTHKTATAGVISGVLPTADFQHQLLMFAGSVSPSFCTSSILMSLLDSIGQASDIMQDGTQDPTKTCDGISIGLGFVASIDQVGPTVPAVTAPDPCVGDAGP